MAELKYKVVVTDHLMDADEIIKNTGKSIAKGNADINAVLDNLGKALDHVRKAKYYIDRD